MIAVEDEVESAERQIIFRGISLFHAPLNLKLQPRITHVNL